MISKRRRRRTGGGSSGLLSRIANLASDADGRVVRPETTRQRDEQSVLATQQAVLLDLYLCPEENEWVSLMQAGGDESATKREDPRTWLELRPEEDFDEKSVGVARDCKNEEDLPDPFPDERR